MFILESYVELCVCFSLNVAQHFGVAERKEEWNYFLLTHPKGGTCIVLLEYILPFS